MEEPVNLIFAYINKEIEFQLQWETRKDPLEDARSKQPQQQNVENAKLQDVVMHYRTPTRPKSSNTIAAEDKRRLIDALVMLDGQPPALAETKAPIKLTRALLQLVRLPIVMREVQRFLAEEKVLANGELRKATAAVALVIIQAYGYMIRHCVRLAYVTSVEAHLIMYLNADDPNTLYLCCRPGDGAEPKRTRHFKALDHAFSTVASFIFLADEASRLPRDWHPPADLSFWAVTFDRLATTHTAVTVAETADGSLYVDDSRVLVDSPLVKLNAKHTHTRSTKARSWEGPHALVKQAA